MRSQVKKLKDILNKSNALKIPNFQREFVWETGQFEKFILDLKNKYAKNEEFFLGTLVLNQGEIVDGQQRITTLSYLLKILESKYNFACEDISVLEKVNEEQKSKNYYHIITKQLQDIEIENESGLYEYMLNCVCFSVLEITENKHEIYGNINSCGKPLEVHELVYSYLHKKNSDEMNNDFMLHSSWELFLNVLKGATASFEEEYVVPADGNGYENQQPDKNEMDSVEKSDMKKQTNLSIDKFFRAYSQIEPEYECKTDLYFSVIDLLERKNSSAEALMKELIQYAKYYMFIVSPISVLNEIKGFSNNNEEFCKALIRHSMLHFSNSIPMLLRLFAKKDTQELTNYLNAIYEVYINALLTNNRLIKNAVIRRMSALDKNITLNKPLKSVIISNLLGSHIETYSENVIKQLEDSLDLLRYTSDRKIITALLVDYELSKVDCIYEQWQDVEKNDGFSVEHIIPQSHEAKADDDVQKLSNLMLLEKNLNSEANAKDFIDKCPTYRKSVFGISKVGESGEKPENLREELYSNLYKHNIKPVFPQYIYKILHKDSNTYSFIKEKTQKEDKYIFYYDDGKNTKKSKIINGIQKICTKNTKNENEQFTKVVASKSILTILYDEHFNKNEDAFAAGLSTMYRTYATSRFINEKEIKRAVGKKVEKSMSDPLVIGGQTIWLSNDEGDYENKIADMIGALVGDAEKAPLIYLEMKAPEFRKHNSFYYSNLVYICGPMSEYLELLQKDTGIVDVLKQSENPPEISTLYTSEIQSLEEIFAKKINIPIYQRHYVWGKKQWNAMEKTIKESKQDCFLGTIVLAKNKDGYEVIDGQQRLSTLFYMFSKEDRKKVFFDDETVQNEFWAGTGRYEGISQRESKLNDSCKKKVKFHVITLEEYSEQKALEVFIGVNGRGKPLSYGEKIKNLLYKKGFEESKIKKLCAEMPSFERFIKAYIEMTLVENISKGNLQDYFDDMDNDDDFGTAYEYILSELNDVSIDSGDDKYDLAYQAFLVQHLVKASQMKKDGMDLQSDMLLYFDRFQKIEQMKKGIKLDGYSNKIQVAMYFHGLCSTNTTLPILMKYFSDDDLFVETVEFLTDMFIIAHTCNFDNALKSMNKTMLMLLNNGVSFENVYGEHKVEEKFYSGLKHNDFYKNSQQISLLMLWRYERYLRKETNEEFEKFVLNCLKDEKKIPSVEHILAQANTPQGSVHKIENLMLLEKNLNSSASNKSEKGKLPAYQKSKYMQVEKHIDMRYDRAEDLKICFTEMLEKYK